MMGENNTFYGKHHTDEAKENCGINKGTIYVNKEGINKRIRPSELDFYLEKGYSKGMFKKSNKGSHWMYKGVESKMVFDDEIEFFLSQGYQRGRKS